MAIRVLIVDDSKGGRDGVLRALRRATDFELIAAVPSSQEGLRLAMDLKPDVLVASTGLQLPTSFELARFLGLRIPTLGVLLVTEVESDEELYEAVRVGAAGYLCRSIGAEALLQAIRRAARGEYLIDDAVLTHPRVAARVLHEFREISGLSKGLQPLLAPLSPREIEILDQAARGNSNKQIARRLSISDQTVKNHISSILRKLAVNDRTQAVVFALRHGWIRVDEQVKGQG
ncbi:MAG: response regulator transcription factor [Chloroflexi bacterium]|nr:response regulator transcription factor [Chloroflexota bacterium]